MNKHKETLKSIAKEKAHYSKLQRESLALAADCDANIKRLEECERVLGAGEVTDEQMERRTA